MQVSDVLIYLIKIDMRLLLAYVSKFEVEEEMKHDDAKWVRNYCPIIYLKS